MAARATGARCRGSTTSRSAVWWTHGSAGSQRLPLLRYHGTRNQAHPASIMTIAGSRGDGTSASQRVCPHAGSLAVGRVRKG